MSATPPPVEPPVTVNEQDKPFFLVLLMTAVLLGVAIYAVIFGKWADAKDMVTTFMGLLAAGWGLYFRAKG
jgi:hypothetical protein